jgi:hypothetical protein
VDAYLDFGNRIFQVPMTFTVGNEPRSVAIGDFNVDDHTDLVVGNYGSDTLSILLGYGNGSFEAQMMFSTGKLANSVAVSNSNSDNFMDLAVLNQGYNTERISWLWQWKFWDTKDVFFW